MSDPADWATSEEAQQALRGRLSTDVLNPLLLATSRLIDEVLPDANEAERRAVLTWMLYETEDALGVLVTGALADAELAGAPIRKIAWATGNYDTANLKRKYRKLREVIESRIAAKKTGGTFPVTAGRKRPGSPDGVWVADVGPLGMTMGSQ